LPPVESEIVDLIGLIYDAVLNPAMWHEAIDRIRLHFNFQTSIMALNRFVHEPISMAVAVNIPEQYERFLNADYADEILRMWGGREVVERFPLEEPVALSSLTNERELLTNRYYTDFGVPNGLVDQAAIILTRDRRQVGNIGFGRHRDVGPVTDDVIAGLRVLAPHLRRAALITGILEEERKARTLFEAVLGAVRSGIVLVDGKARIIYANPAAKGAFAAGDPLRDEHGRLELRGEVTPGQLITAIQAAAQGDLPLGRRGIAIPGTRADGTPFVVHVLPLGDRTVRTGMPSEAAAAVFIADRDDDPHFVSDAATMIYGLTPAETRVFNLIVAGHSSADMARLLAIAPSTLKWHTLGLFDKTGLHRRSELVRLATALRPSS
jgi:DNA-binding CsgD family transcriptional regulator